MSAPDPDDVASSSLAAREAPAEALSPADGGSAPEGEVQDLDHQIAAALRALDQEPDSEEKGAERMRLLEAQELSSRARIMRASATGMRATAKLDMAGADKALAQLKGEGPSQYAAEAYQVLSAFRLIMTSIAGVLNGADAREAAVRIRSAIDQIPVELKESHMAATVTSQTQMFRFLASMLEALAEVRAGDQRKGEEAMDSLTRQMHALPPELAKQANSIEPNLLFASAGVVRATNPEAAEGVLERAARSSEFAANAYYADDANQKAYYLGQAEYYRAMKEYWRTALLFESWRFREIPSRQNITLHFDRALALFSTAGLAFHVEGMRKQTECLRDLAGIYADLAEDMVAIFTATFAHKDSTKLHALVEEAADVRDRATTAEMRSAAQQLIDRASEVAVLQQPRRVDFGVASGIVACVSFVAVLLCAGLIDWMFGLDAPGYSIILLAAVFGLIAGFGYGAIRFRSLLSLSSGSDG